MNLTRNGFEHKLTSDALVQAVQSTTLEPPKQRELVKYKLQKSPVIKTRIDDAPDFDQFADKQTTYNFDTYSTTIDHSKVTPDLKQKARKLEQEIGNS